MIADDNSSTVNVSSRTAMRVGFVFILTFSQLTFLKCSKEVMFIAVFDFCLRFRSPSPPLGFLRFRLGIIAIFETRTLFATAAVTRRVDDYQRYYRVSRPSRRPRASSAVSPDDYWRMGEGRASMQMRLLPNGTASTRLAETRPKLRRLVLA